MAKKKSSHANPPAPKAGPGTPSTVKYLQFAEVRNDTVIMKDGTLRAVLLVSSINFFLKSEDEQTAIIQAYMQLLNTFDFPIQIVIQSRKFDISKYLVRLGEKEKEQTNELLRLQIADYRQFVTELVELGDIMDKKFYVVVPYDPVSDTKRGFASQLKNLFVAAGEVQLKNEQFLKRKHFLDQRVANVMGGLVGMGLNAATLDTQSLIELLYAMYNPDTAPQEKMVETDTIQLEG